ncbi:hypothetical protein [Lysobacter tyrosinilyticus]
MSRVLPFLLVGLVLFGAPAVHAQGFSALVSPPRFEDRAAPGTTYRNVVEITNVSSTPAHLMVKTADWILDNKGAAIFSDTLAPNSCRPWVGIEAADFTIAPNGKRRYRFEVAVPASAPRGQCRFALMLEGEPQVIPGTPTPPVAGRIGVIVYLTIGEAAAELRLAGTTIDTVEGVRVPVLKIRNDGDAHGRLAGFIDGVDARGRKFVLTPSGLPVLPGETRAIALTPQGDDPDTPAPTITFPLRLKGRLEWGERRLDIDTAVAQ